ncbi:LysR family transcriptional regulator [Sphingobium amiense]|uniref:LysR family transcriptional regulator n=1 Tax=Sphingobium amiense TaxID=135719 RepID=UPI0013C3783C|nr:LysR family transcriptional regulator [Sphingobium amiense]
MRIVLAAAEEQSFAGAAQRENTSLSAVSRRVAELEQRVGIALFDRHDRGVALTDAGARFVEQLYDVFERLELIALDLEAVGKGTRGLVRISAPMSAISGDLPARIADFMRKHPGIEVQITEETAVAAIHGVTVGDIDMALIPGSPPPPNLLLFPWSEDELVVILPKGHALAGREAVTLEDLADEPFICMPRDSGLFAMYRQKLSAVGRKMKERALTTSFESIRRMVSEGLGISILPGTTVHPYAEKLGLVVLRLDESWSKRPHFFCTREADRCSAATKALLAHLTA